MKPFRSTAGRFLAWAWFVFAGLNFVDLAIRGRDRESLIAAAVLLLGCGLAYTFGLRPRVTADEQAMAVVNPLRTTTLPWSEVKKLETGRTLTVTHAGGQTTSFALQSSARAKARAARKKPDPNLPPEVAAKIHGRTPVDFAVDELKEMQKNGKGHGQMSVTWSWPGIAAVAAPLVVLVVLLLA